MSNNDIDEIKANISGLNVQLDRIEKAITGDRMGTKGLEPRLSGLEDKQDAMSRKFVYFSGFLTALVIAWESFRHKIIG